MNRATKTMTERNTVGRIIGRYAPFVFAIGFMLVSLIPLTAGFAAVRANGVAKEAIIGLWAGSLFLGPGLLVLWALNWGSRLIKKEELDRLTWPSQPWKWREDWRNRTITESAWHKAYSYIGFAFFWNYFCWGVLLILIAQQESLNVLLAVGGFCVIGVCLAGVAIAYVLRARKWGRTELNLECVPIAVGQTLLGRIRVSPNVEMEDGIWLTLSCSEEHACVANILGYEKETGDRFESAIWSQSRILQAVSPSPLNRDAVEIPIALDIPDHLPGTIEEDRVTWAIKMSSASGLLPFESEFELPVYRVKNARSLRSKVADQSASKHWKEPVFADYIGRCRGELICDTRDRIEIEFTKRTPAKLAMALFAGPAVAVIFCIFGSVLGGLLGILFGFIGTIAALVGIADVFKITLLVADLSQLSLRTEWLGVGYTRRFALGQIETVESKTTHFKNSLPENRKAYDVKLVMKDNRQNRWHALLPKLGHGRTLLPQIGYEEVSTAIAARLNEHIARFSNSSTLAAPMANQTQLFEANTA
ncbi:MAG: hypothetical protein WBD20_19635 [Pirellulaceae bacterium]